MVMTRGIREAGGRFGGEHFDDNKIDQLKYQHTKVVCVTP